MNISPDDFEKLGIDESNLDEKAEQTNVWDLVWHCA